MKCCSKLQVKMKLLHPDCAPTRAYENAAGWDLKASETVVLEPRKWTVIRTGVFLELPPNLQAEIRPRSGLAAKHGITVLNSPGTIDADYRGEVGVILINHSEESYTIKCGDKIAQMVIMPFWSGDIDIVDELCNTERGDSGFGSSGE